MYEHYYRDKSSKLNKLCHCKLHKNNGKSEFLSSPLARLLSEKELRVLSLSSLLLLITSGKSPNKIIPPLFVCSQLSTDWVLACMSLPLTHTTLHCSYILQNIYLSFLTSPQLAMQNVSENLVFYSKKTFSSISSSLICPLFQLSQSIF